MTERDPMSSREAYDAYVATWPEECRSQWWPVPWRLATPGEKAVKIALWAGHGIIISMCLVAVVFLDGLLIDSGWSSKTPYASSHRSTGSTR